MGSTQKLNNSILTKLLNKPVTQDNNELWKSSTAFDRDLLPVSLNMNIASCEEIEVVGGNLGEEGECQEKEGSERDDIKYQSL